MADQPRESIADRILRELAEARAGRTGEHLENARARAQNRVPDVPQGQRTREHEYDIAMGRRPNRE